MGIEGLERDNSGNELEVGPTSIRDNEVPKIIIALIDQTNAPEIEETTDN